MNWRGVSCAVALTGAFTSVGALTIGAAACITSTNRCLPGYHYVAQYKACFPDEDASADASSTDGSARLEGDAAANGDGAEGLGDSCTGDPDCAGKKASYCLKSPTAPTQPGVCSVPQCALGDCGSTFECCDCSHAARPELQAWPNGVCVPKANSSTVESFGCVCQ